jgi:peptidoglycan hydrolase CwlO-like protein
LAFVATIFAKFPEIVEDEPKEVVDEKDKIISDLKQQVALLTDELSHLRNREAELLAEIERLRQENRRTHKHTHSLFQTHI